MPQPGNDRRRKKEKDEQIKIGRDPDPPVGRGSDDDHGPTVRRDLLEDNPARCVPPNTVT